MRYSIVILSALVTLILSGCGSSGVNEVKTPERDQIDRTREVIRIPSKDGTRIAMECAGEGPTLIMVHGGTGNRSRWTPMIPVLSEDLTVCAMDRRGRGDSEDAPEYSLQKEAEDVAALVDSRAGTVYVLGHSYGGVAALEATFLTDRISKLILYEPPFMDPVGRNLAVADTMERLIKKGDRERATTTFLSEIVNVTPDEVEAMKLRPSWPELVKTINLQPRQIRALAGFRYDARRIRSVRIPTLLLRGGETASPHLKQAIDSLQATLPDPTLLVLQGQQHNAMDNAREILAEAILKFLLGTPGNDSEK